MKLITSLLVASLFVLSSTTQAIIIDGDLNCRSGTMLELEFMMLLGFRNNLRKNASAIHF